jgi:hypothetical protein
LIFGDETIDHENSTAGDRQAVIKHIASFGLIFLVVGYMPHFQSMLAAQQKDSIPDALNRIDPDAADDSEPRQDDAPLMWQFDLVPERLSEMAYGMLGGSRSDFEQSLRRRVRKTLHRIEQLGGLSDEIREKVTNTADLEFQRLDADIAALVADTPRRPTQQHYHTFYMKLIKIGGPHLLMNRGAGNAANPTKTLWEKVLESSLSEDQLEVLRQDQRQRTEYRDRVMRLETLLQISRVLGLSGKQLRELEAIADANPQAWITLESAWTTLAAMPEQQQRERFTENQRVRLSRPLEFSNDLQPVMTWDMPE